MSCSIIYYEIACSECSCRNNCSILYEKMSKIKDKSFKELMTERGGFNDYNKSLFKK